ncbi:MAG: hypothetical protein AB1592_06705 [Pseudomonadota bacterium]
MPTSLPLSASRARSPRRGRRLLLGWSVADWGLFIAAYGIVLCAVLFVAPEKKAADTPAPQVVTQAR